MNDSQGSIWRKWDLHVHTPASYLNGYGDNWDKFVDGLIESGDKHEIEAFATADYFTIEGYEKLLEYYDPNTQILTSKTDSSKSRRMCIIPGMELRVKVFTQDNASINLHVLFDTQCTPDFIKENFLSDLRFSHRGIGYKLTPNNLLAVGKAISDGVEVDLNISAAGLSAIDKRKYYKASYNAITLEKDNIKDAIKSINDTLSARGKKPAIVAVAVKGHGGIDSLEWFESSGSMSRSGLMREDFSADADVLFSCSQADIDFYSGNSPGTSKAEVIRRFKKIKPCVWGSDAHESENIFHPSRGATTNYTWIKADASYEGLKQIIYEPTDRIKIQENSPYEDFYKPYFSEINIRKGSILETAMPKFDNTALKLNRDMIAIIGSRGGGKSLLIDVISVLFKHTSGGENERLSRIQKTLDFKVDYTKTDGSVSKYSLSDENNLNYLHVHQGQVKNIVTDHKTLDREIKKLLGIKVSDDQISSYDKTEDEIDKIERLINFLQIKNDNGTYTNTTVYQKARKKIYEDLIETITTSENRDKIVEYRINSIKLEYLEEKIDNIQDLLKNIAENSEDLENQIKYVNSINLDIDSEALDTLTAQLRDGATLSVTEGMFVVEGIDIDAEIQDAIDEVNKDSELIYRFQIVDEMSNILKPVPVVDFENQKLVLQENAVIARKQVDSIAQTNEDIRQGFINSGIKIDVSNLLEKVAEYQKAISILDKNVALIISRQRELNDLTKTLYGLGQKINDRLLSQKQEIEDRWDIVNSPDDKSREQKALISKLLEDIQVSGVVDFNTIEFYELLSSDLNMTRFKSSQGTPIHSKLKVVFNVSNYEDYIKLLSGDKIINLNDDLISIGEFVQKRDYFNMNSISSFLNSLYLPSKHSAYLGVISESTYLGRQPLNLSVGQRGTFYVCLKLATDSFSTPLIFDQPDDDLDSDFIVSKLVPIFCEIKKYRQVIIITHNPNFVVNTDVEQVIVALNNDETLNYVSGSIENLGIRKNIYQILEGGKDAFLEREEKYGF